MNELVSILTPAYMAERFITDALESVQQQSYSHWEMLVVDDGSSDNTANIVARRAESDPRIKLIQQKNSGPALARQAALDASSGRYIAFLDSDDYWLPNKLFKQLAFMRKHSAPLSYTRFRRINATASTVGHEIKIPAQLSYSQLLRNTGIATSSAMLDRQMTGEFRFKQTYYDDYALWLELLKRGHTALGLDEDLMRYRVIEKSVSRNKGNSARMVWRTYRDVENLGIITSADCFIQYAWRAWWKYRKF